MAFEFFPTTIDIQNEKKKLRRVEKGQLRGLSAPGRSAGKPWLKQTTYKVDALTIFDIWGGSPYIPGRQRVVSYINVPINSFGRQLNESYSGRGESYAVFSTDSLAAFRFGCAINLLFCGHNKRIGSQDCGFCYIVVWFCLGIS